MNDRARQALIDAALNGVRQIKHQLYDSYGGRCAGGVILEALNGQPTFRSPYDWEELAEAGMRQPFRCPHECCNFWADNEWRILIHMNNHHGDDFLTIANRMPVSGEGKR